MRWVGAALALLAFAVVLPIPNAGASLAPVFCLNEEGEPIPCPERPPAVSGAPAREALAARDARVLDSDRVIDRHWGEFIVVRRPWIDSGFCSSAVERRRYYDSDIGGYMRQHEDVRVTYVHTRLNEDQCHAAIEIFDQNSVSESAFAREVEWLRCTEPTARTCFNEWEELRTFASRQADWTNVFFEWRGRFLPWQAEGAHMAQASFGRHFVGYVATMRDPIIDPRDPQVGLVCVRAFQFSVLGNEEAPSVTMCRARSFETVTTFLSFRQTRNF